MSREPEICEGSVKLVPLTGLQAILRASHPISSMPEPSAHEILVIDDDRKLCRLIFDYLEPLGYRITAACNGPDVSTSPAPDRLRNRWP